MSDDNGSSTSRRSFIKAAGALTAIGATGVGASLLSGGASASASTLDITDSSVTTDAGDISSIGVALTHEVTWDGFDVPVAAVAYTDTLTVAGDDGGEYTHTVYDNTGSPVRLADFSGEGDSDGWGGAGEYANPGEPTQDGAVYADIDWTVLSDTPSEDAATETPGDIADTTFASPPADDTTATVDVTYEKVVTLYGEDSNGDLYKLGDEDGTVGEVSSAGTFTVSVTNQDATTSGSSSDGESSVQA